MIKINLVAETPTPTAARKGPEISLGARQGDTILVIVLVIAALITGGRWYLLKSEFKEVKATERERRRERDELQQYITKVDELEAKREALRQKIEIINTLKQNQRGPVRVMDEVSRALPDLVWITRMSFGANLVKITGSALDENAVANYISNLHASPFFNEPTLKDLARGSMKGSQLFNFSLECTFNPAPPELASEDG